MAPLKAEPAAVPAGRRAQGWSRYSNRTFYLFVSPWLLGFLALTVIPLIYALCVSFTNFNGAQLYAFSKTALERASGGTITGVHIDVGVRPTPDTGGIWFSLQPATSPGATFATANGGTEYLLSSLDFSASLDNRIAVWQLTNTRSLNTATRASESW